MSTGTMAQIVECLPSKCEALSSNPCNAKQQQQQKPNKQKLYVYKILNEKLTCFHQDCGGNNFVSN
jgi:hypothetical protein